MSVALDRFYPIAANSEWVGRLVGLGARLIQLRIKNQPADVIRTEVRTAKALCAGGRAQLIVNDHWQIALEEGCGFVHLGQSDLDGADTGALRKAGVRIGVSTHDHAELERALALNPDYVALGPVYPTLLKKMPWAPQGLDRVREWKQLIGDTPLVAIGGLTVARLPSVFASGADIAAVVTDIISSIDPETKTREWIAATRGAA